MAGKTSKAKSERIDLGLALLHRVALPGVCYTSEEIAKWCDCTESAIYQIEQRALHKIQKRLAMSDMKTREELRDGLTLFR